MTTSRPLPLSMPVALKLAGRACLVVGGGSEAIRRVRDLLEAGAKVQLVAPRPVAELRQLAVSKAIELEERDYVPADLQGKWLAVLCERNRELARRMAQDAEQRRVFFCAIDQPAHNSFAHVAVARSGPLFLAVGSEGKAPALARRLRMELQKLVQDRIFASFVERIVALREATPAVDRARVLNRAVEKLHLEWRLMVDED